MNRAVEMQNVEIEQRDGRNINEGEALAGVSNEESSQIAEEEEDHDGQVEQEEVLADADYYYNLFVEERVDEENEDEAEEDKGYEARTLLYPGSNLTIQQSLILIMCFFCKTPH